MLLKTCLLTLACLTVATLEAPLRAQTTPVGPFGTPAEAARHQAAYMVAAEKAGYASRPAFFYRNRLDVTKTKALRRLGVDMLQMDHSILIDGAYGYQEETLFADWVVRGTVTEETGDSSRRVCLHTTYKLSLIHI